MKKTFLSKATVLLFQALIFCGSLQADSQVIYADEQQQVGNLQTDFVRETLRSRDKDSSNKGKEKFKIEDQIVIDPIIQHLYAFNTQMDSNFTVVPIPANSTVGNDVPFNNGNSLFPPTPIVIGTAIRQLDDTDFLIFKNGEYLVTFYGYAEGGVLTGVGVQLFVRSVATGPAHISNFTGMLLSFSEIIKISGASLENPALLEVKAVSSTPGPTLLRLLSNQSNGVNATLEIIKTK